jgi:hypothetical protein
MSRVFSDDRHQSRLDDANERVQEYIHMSKDPGSIFVLGILAAIVIGLLAGGIYLAIQFPLVVGIISAIVVGIPLLGFLIVQAVILKHKLELKQVKKELGVG